MKLIAAAALLLVLSSCSQNIQNKEAVKSAVVDYLTARQEKTGIMMSAMEVEVLNVNFQTDRAQATVAFKLKTGDGGMQMSYELERSGNKWVVKGVSTTGHEGADKAPGELPPGHPSTGSELPAGHPDVGTKQK